jgi:cyclopropane fatty-acyl-phospholipid synthase-like methyltransferase
MAWTKKDIVDYYRKNQFGYRLWGRNMHYGYWDEGVRHQRQATRRFNEVLAERARIDESDLVLDAGCGVGGASTFLAQTRGCRAVGITICPHQVAQAYRNAHKDGVGHRTRFFEMDYLSTGFKDEQFDVVWGLESICYAESKEKFVREAYRLLKPGGRLIVADGFAGRGTYEGKDRAMMQRWLDGWIVNSLDTPDDWRRFAAETGFRDIDYRDVTANVLLSSKLMYYASFFFIVLHLIDKVKPLGPYPSDALYHQYRALKRGLWEYGIFYAAK